MASPVTAENPVKTMMRAGKVALGMNVRLARSGGHRPHRQVQRTRFEFLKSLKTGDKVDLTFTKAVAVSVEPAPKKK